MTIQELIEKLKTYPQDMRVVVAGYEDGYNDITILKEKQIAIDVLTEWYYGQHADSNDYRVRELKNTTIENVLIIDGENLITTSDMPQKRYH